MAEFVQPSPPAARPCKLFETREEHWTPTERAPPLTTLALPSHQGHALPHLPPGMRLESIATVDAAARGVQLEGPVLAAVAQALDVCRRGCRLGGLLQAIEGGCLRTRCCLYEQRFKRTKGWGAGWGKRATKPRKNGAQSLHVSSRLQPAALPSRTQCHCCFPVLGAGIHLGAETLQTVPTVQKHATRALQGSWQTQPSEHVARTARREARTPLRGRGVPTTRFLVVFHHHSYQRDSKQGVFQLQTPRPSRIVKDWPCAALSRAWGDNTGASFQGTPAFRTDREGHTAAVHVPGHPTLTEDARGRGGIAALLPVRMQLGCALQQEACGGRGRAGDARAVTTPCAEQRAAFECLPASAPGCAARCAATQRDTACEAAPARKKMGKATGQQPEARGTPDRRPAAGAPCGQAWAAV